MQKNFKLKTEEIVGLIPQMGGCFATDKITVDGMQVGYMYREQAYKDIDSGWRFFSGTEEQEYIDDSNNTMIYNINYDPAVSYLNFPIGTELERIENSNKFQKVI